MYNRFNTYSKLLSQEHLKTFKKDNFFYKISTALIVFNSSFKDEMVTFATCDKYFEGVYLPKEEKIVLCSNALYHYSEFKDAIQRQLIKMYDHK